MSKGKVENCCENCSNAEEYSGWEAHICVANGSVMRAEVYNCDYFESDGSASEEVSQ